MILIEAAVAGLWDFTLSDRKIEIRIGLFEDPTPRAMAAIEAEAGLIAGFFNAREVKITRVLIRSPVADRGPSAYLKPLAGQEAKPPAARPPAPKAAKGSAQPAKSPSPRRPPVKPVAHKQTGTASEAPRRRTSRG